MGQLAACEKAALAAATRIFVVSDVERRSLIGRGLDPRRIVLNPNGVDTSRFDRGGGQAVRERLCISPDELVIGFVGSFGPWHGAPVLAQAFGEYARIDTSARLVLVGEGPELLEVKDRLRAAGVFERAIFAGKVAPSDVPGYLDACDVLVSPHVPLPAGEEFFGSPTKLFEYMAARKPIVASALGQIADVLVDGETALLVPPGDAGAIVQALERLAASPELGSALAERARAAAGERHGWDRNAERIIDAYAELAEEAIT
jgi:glycosyltransferase involved in cell wall biosynthesis